MFLYFCKASRISAVFASDSTVNRDVSRHSEILSRWFHLWLDNLTPENGGVNFATLWNGFTLMSKVAADPINRVSFFSTYKLWVCCCWEWIVGSKPNERKKSRNLLTISETTIVTRCENIICMFKTAERIVNKYLVQLPTLGAAVNDECSECRKWSFCCHFASVN